MNILLKLPKLNTRIVVKLTSFYNAVEGNFQSLMAMGLNSSHFGPLLIQVILKSLFNQINTCPKVGKNN